MLSASKYQICKDRKSSVLDDLEEVTVVRSVEERFKTPTAR